MVEADCPPHLQEGLDESTPAPSENREPDATAESRVGDPVGEVDISLLGGTCIKLPVYLGQTCENLRADFARHRPVPAGLILQLLHPAGMLRADEEVSGYAGASLTALFTRMPLSEESRSLLALCTCRTPEDGQIELLEVLFHVSDGEAKDLADLVMNIQPSRLILYQGVEVSSLAALVAALTGRLDSLRILKICGVRKDSIADLTTLVGKCPALQHVYLEGKENDELTMRNIANLRASTTARVVI